jgi:addiction module RelE/StbE family toxin
VARVSWTPEALRNLDTIGDYLRTVAPDVADRIVVSLVESMDAVMDFPRLGRMVPEFELDDLREVIVDDYRVVYELRGDTAWVVTVLHGAMDVPSRLRTIRERD